MLRRLGPVTLAALLALPALAQEETNKAVFMRSIDEVWHAKDLDVIDELYADDFTMVQVNGLAVGAGPAGYRQFVQAYFDAVPNMHFDVEQIIAEGEWAAIRIRAGGTAEGSLFGLPATGTDAFIGGISIARFRDGQFVQNTSHLDRLAMMQQMGVLPPAEGTVQGWSEQVHPRAPGDPEISKQVAARVIDELWNQANPALIDELYTEDFVFHSNDGPTGDLAAWRGFVAVYLTAFPDVQFRVNTVFAEGDLVVQDWRATGTHTGPLLDVPATERTIDIGGASIYCVQGGRIAEAWNLFDRLGMYQQLGLIPGAEPTAVESASWGEVKVRGR